MIPLKLNKERKYILAIGVVLLLAGLGYRFFPSGLGNLDQTDEIALKSRKVMEYKKKTASMAAVKKVLQESRGKLQRAEGLLLNGDTEALAAVDIQNILNEIAFRSGVEVKTMRILRSEKMGNEHYLGIRVEARLKATTRQLKDMLYRVGCSRKLLSIQQLSIDVPSTSYPLDLDIAVVVSGVMKVNGV
jgi:general secretion pathway protein M